MSEFSEMPLLYIKGAGPTKADLLKKELGIETCGDLLQHYPFRYVDRSRFYTVHEIDASSQYIQLKLTLTSKNIQGEGAGRRLVIIAEDTSGQVELVWFRSVLWMDKSLKLNLQYVVFGKPSFFNGKVNIVHPEMELLSEFSRFSVGFLQPVYSVTEKLKKAGLDSKGIQRLVAQVLHHHAFGFTENLSAMLSEKLGLMLRKTAIRCIHSPQNAIELEQAIRRIKFEELFFIQIRLLRQKKIRIEKNRGFIFKTVGEVFHQFFNSRIPFELTDAQKKVIKEIRQDTLTGHQMNRLLQGDVGSGKTIVALLCMLIAIDNGFQTCLMAPTEILARQHFISLKELLGEGLVRVELLTGSVSNSARKPLLNDLAMGSIQILVGTHALLEPTVVFKNLGLAVIDEQHRFGVEQRSRLWEKGIAVPHILVMTATPIPRTLAMTLYGDLDISVIDSLPKGRKPIETYHYFENLRLKVIGFIEKQIALGRQVYVVYPIIEESKKLDLLHLNKGFEQLERSFPKPKYHISNVHGKMKAADKDFEMQRFIKGETQIMVATTVIEVGVNVPNASVMVIENAERFGLSTLHQLRGRVGRGAEQSYCILMTSNKLSTESRLRMETMVRTNDGFEIAETDLAIRGMGNLEGTQQSGIVDLKLADLAKDQGLLLLARHSAEEVLAGDAQLESRENSPIKHFLLPKTERGMSWEKIS